MNMRKDELLRYWIESSENDFNVMNHLFEKGDYTWALFIGHLVLERLLKAQYVQKFETLPPFTHDLVRLSEKAGLVLSDDQKDLFDTITTFNLQARYDDYKMTFYRKCTHEFTDNWK